MTCRRYICGAATWGMWIFFLCKSLSSRLLRFLLDHQREHILLIIQTICANNTTTNNNHIETSYLLNVICCVTCMTSYVRHITSCTYVTIAFHIRYKSAPVIIILYENFIVAIFQAGQTNALIFPYFLDIKSHQYQLNVEINFKIDSNCRKYLKMFLYIRNKT